MVAQLYFNQLWFAISWLVEIKLGNCQSWSLIHSLIRALHYQINQVKPVMQKLLHDFRTKFNRKIRSFNNNFTGCNENYFKLIKKLLFIKNFLLKIFIFISNFITAYLKIEQDINFSLHQIFLLHTLATLNRSISFFAIWFQIQS